MNSFWDKPSKNVHLTLISDRIYGFNQSKTYIDSTHKFVQIDNLILKNIAEVILINTAIIAQNTMISIIQVLSLKIFKKVFH